MRIERDYSSLFKELATETAFRKDQISSGAFGTIERIFHFPPAVTKKVTLQNHDNPHLNQRLKEEQEILKKLFHPNIVSYYGFFKCEDPQNFGLVMEYCDGIVGDVSEFIRNPMYEYSLDAVIFWATQLFDGLTYLHSHSVIHRDIKPANIFVAKDFVMKIGDFDGSTGSMLDAECIGTDRYRSPKQLRDQENQNPLPLDDKEEKFTINERDDVYSMGLVICELLRREFGNKEVLTLMRFRRILNELDDSYAYDVINQETLDGKTVPRLECTIKELKNLGGNHDDLRIFLRMEEKIASGVERPNFQCSDQKLFDIVNKCIKLKRENRPLALEVFKELQNLKTNTSDPYLLVKEWKKNNAPMIPNNFFAGELDDKMEVVDELNLDPPSVVFGRSNEPIEINTIEKKEKRFEIGNDNHRSLIFLDSQEIRRHAERARTKWCQKKSSLSPTAIDDIRQGVMKEKRYEHMLFQGFDFHRGNSFCEAESVENLYREHIDWYFYSKLHQLSVKLIPETPSAQDYEDWDEEEDEEEEEDEDEDEDEDEEPYLRWLVEFSIDV